MLRRACSRQSCQLLCLGAGPIGESQLVRLWRNGEWVAFWMCKSARTSSVSTWCNRTGGRLFG